MEITSFTLDFVAKTITVLFVNEDVKIYADAASYISDYPHRKGDADAVWATVQ